MEELEYSYIEEENKTTISGNPLKSLVMELTHMEREELLKMLGGGNRG